MRTSRPISTISYNSGEFLKAKIDYWKSQGIIEYGMWIKHKPEADEKKAHYHVFLKPAQLIQTMDLELDSCEIDPLFPDKPLKMISFRTSNESDWVLYGIHDREYLIEKGLTKQHHYDLDDIESTCVDTLHDIISHLIESRKGRLEYRLMECINRGMSWRQIVGSGLIPLRHLGGAKIMYAAITEQADID